MTILFLHYFLISIQDRNLFKNLNPSVFVLKPNQLSVCINLTKLVVYLNISNQTFS